jgi:hypothetical protein
MAECHTLDVHRDLPEHGRLPRTALEIGWQRGRLAEPGLAVSLSYLC